jgi:YVTN family beta-propeller protein
MARDTLPKISNQTNAPPTRTNSRVNAMNLRISPLVAVAAFALAGVLGSPQGLAQNAYIPSADRDNVSVIDTETNTVIATIPVGTFPMGVAVSPDGSKVYVTNTASASNNVSVIDTAKNRVTATIPVGQFPLGVAVTPDGARHQPPHLRADRRDEEPWRAGAGANKVYVANGGSNNVSVIDAATNTVIATIPASHGGTRSPEHLVPGAAPVSPQRLQMPPGHHPPVLDHAIEYGRSTQPTIISGFQLSAILGKPSPAKAAALSNLHRAKRSPLSRAFVLRRLSDAGPLYWVDRSRRAGIRNPSRKKRSPR